MEAKYLFTFRRFNCLSYLELVKICKEIGLSYQKKDKRKLAKELAVIFYKGKEKEDAN